MNNENIMRKRKDRKTRTERREAKENGKGRLLINLSIIVVVALITILYVNRNGGTPWASDIFGHLFKGEILFDSINEGNFYLNYDFNWYNGLQPYRYWGPMPYYILASLNFITHNIVSAYNLLIMVVFIVGGWAFVFWGYYLKRNNLGLIFGLLWFFVPNNLEIIFSQGNLPTIIIITVVPYIYLFYYKALVEEKLINCIVVSLLMAFITLNHAMLTALVGVSLFLYTLVYCILNKNYQKGFVLLVFAFLGILLSSFWLLPALKGGILGQDKEVVAETMKVLTFPLSKSLNPFYRLADKEMYYFGLAFAITALLGSLFSNKKERAGFVVPIIILMGTTTVAYTILSKLPLSQLFWMSRLTSMAICMIFFSIMLWKRLNEIILAVFICTMCLDCVISFNAMANHRQPKFEQIKYIEAANDLAVQRVAMVDASSDGSFPSYYITYDDRGVGMPQTYGWAWQGATTSKNIVQINDTWENNYFVTMFDRCLELGADVVIVKLSLVKSEAQLLEDGKKLGYKEAWRDDNHIIFKFDVNKTFGTIVDYEGIAIGKFSANICNLYPTYTVGESLVLDDYSIEDFEEYEDIYLSGFTVKDRAYCEELIDKLDKQSKNVVIDMTGMDDEGFRSVYPSNIKFNENYGAFYRNGKLCEMTDFPKDLADFRGAAISGVKTADEDNKCVLSSRVLNYVYEETKNVKFIGLNIPYYAMVTKDKTALSIMEDVFERPLYELPDRKVVEVDIDVQSDKKIIIKADKPGVLVPIASIDAFIAEKGEYETLNNLVMLKGDSLTLAIGSPFVKIGLIISTIAFLSIIILSIVLKKSKLKKIMKLKEECENGVK